MSGSPFEREAVSSVWDLFMQFCPRCGVKLAKTEEPAECSACGWIENDGGDDGDGR